MKTKDRHAAQALLPVLADEQPRAQARVPALPLLVGAMGQMNFKFEGTNRECL